MGSQTDQLRGGTDTARLSAAEQDRIWREERKEDTRQRLVCFGETTGAEALGLDPAVGPGTPCGSRAARLARLATGRPCETCRTPAVRRREVGE